ncbi:unnamed protein product [Rangifer tarandus platyrhynchus]|uniref:Uncharacterized protein n=1 Tax=Rangifer tarandus platyrhynchus TaxID=3082113 RepID=A0AC59Z241_RANTA
MRGAGLHSEEQAQEGDRSTLDSTSAHEAQLLAGRDVYIGDGSACAALARPNLRPFGWQRTAPESRARPLRGPRAPLRYQACRAECSPTFLP